jgi:hypothetical protein
MCVFSNEFGMYEVSDMEGASQNCLVFGNLYNKVP